MEGHIAAVGVTDKISIMDGLRATSQASKKKLWRNEAAYWDIRASSCKFYASLRLPDDPIEQEKALLKLYEFAQEKETKGAMAWFPNLPTIRSMGGGSNARMAHG
jgi:hypothetical protein